jgi:CubicO group peptidase (beta-lactamase class C family)
MKKIQCRVDSSLRAHCRGAAFGLLLLSESLSASAAPVLEVAAVRPASSPSKTAFDADAQAELDSYVQNALGTFDVPGAAVAVIQGGKLVYEGAFGVRGEGHSAPVDSETLFMIGSVTKSMTATTLATLVDDGLVAWDALVQKYLPTFELSVPAYSEQLTLRQLLSHQSGVSRYDVALFLYSDRPRQLIDDAASFPVYAAPGESFEYQNQMYALAGFVASRAAGASYTNASLDTTYERLLRERLFEALGMSKSTLDFEQAMRSADHAWPNEYDPRSGTVTAVQPSYERFTSSIPAAGAVWSNLEEMTLYALMQISGGRNRAGRHVVSEAALAETHTPMIAIPEGAYGLGWFILQGPDGTLIEHSGGTAGFGCDVVLSPDHDWGVVVLTNRASSEYFLAAVERYAIEILFGLDRSPDSDLTAAELALETQLSAIVELTNPATAADVANYVGAYERDVQIFRRGADVIVQTTLGELVARPVAGYPGAFLVVGNTGTGGVAQFTSDSAGQVTVTIGLLDDENGTPSILEPVTLHKLPKRSAWPHGFSENPPADWLRAVRYLRDFGVRPRANALH